MRGRWDQRILALRHLASALELNLPLHEALSQLRQETSERTFRQVLTEVEGDLAQGLSLDEALSRHPAWFGLEVLYRLRVGHQAGQLPQALGQAAQFVERSFLLQQRLKRVLVYPVTVSSLILLDLFVLAIIVLPRLSELYGSLSLPFAVVGWHTRMLVMLNSPWGYLMMALFIFGTIGLLVTFLSMTYSERSFWHRLDPLRFRLPFWGRVQRQVEAVRFCRCLALLLRGGVGLPEALGVLEQNSAGRWMRQVYGTAREQVEQGGRLGEGFEHALLFPPTLLWTLGATEKQGSLVGGLEHLADFYQEKTETDLAIVREAMEPLLIVLVGILVAFVIVALYYPLFQVTRLFDTGAGGAGYGP